MIYVNISGQTHPNECQFQYSSCIAKKTSGIELNIVKYVACSEAIESSIDHNVIRSTLPPVSRPNLVVSSSIDSQSAYSTRSFQRAKVPECNADCPEEYRPVCDNKGRTHNNKCQFDYENCQSKTETFYVVSLGVCPPQEPLLLVNGSANQPNRADSVPKILERTNLADCNSSCPRDYMPVCATNGNTYPNR